MQDSPTDQSHTNREVAHCTRDSTLWLWLWLGFAIYTCLAFTPSDPFSIGHAIIHGFVSFVTGIGLASTQSVWLRIAGSLAWVLFTYSYEVPISIFDGDMGIAKPLIGILNIGFGVQCFFSLEPDIVRRRILCGFCVGYLCGSLLGLIGQALGAVLGIRFAKRSLQPKRYSTQRE